jgi:hypothetical protein
MGEEVSNKYTLSYRAPFTSGWRKSHSTSLAEAMTSAWRKHSRGYSVDNITHEREVFIDSGVMTQVLDEMDNLVRETPERPLSEITEQVIRGYQRPG